MLQEALDPDDMVDFSDVADGLHRTTSSMSNASDFKNHGKHQNCHGHCIALTPW